MNRVQFQHVQFQQGMSLFELFEQFGTEAQCQAVLERDLGVNYPTTWLVHHKLMLAEVAC